MLNYYFIPNSFYFYDSGKSEWLFSLQLKSDTFPEAFYWLNWIASLFLENSDALSRDVALYSFLVSQRRINLLSLFDYTGNWSRPYREAGWHVVQIDILLGQDILEWDYRQFDQAATWIVEIQANVAFDFWGVLQIIVYLWHIYLDRIFFKGLALARPTLFLWEKACAAMCAVFLPPIARFCAVNVQH